MITYAKTGEYHLDRGMSFQDAFHFRETDEYRFFAIADGASSCENSQLGAQTACRAAADYYLTYAGTLGDCSDEKIAYLILDQVRDVLESLAGEQDIPADSLSSTLTFCCVDRRSLEMTVFHLGDGAVYLLDGDAQEQVLTPYRSRNAPPLTMTVNAYKTAQIRRISLSPETRVLMCTDGLLKLLDGSDGESIRAHLARQDFDGLCDTLDGISSFDDCSFVAF